jgi:flagellar motor switch protein FliN
MQQPPSSPFDDHIEPEPESTEDEALAVDPAMRRFLDVPIQVRIELDRKRITLGEALTLREHMVIALERSAGENVDLLLNGMRVGNGEIVVIEDTMGLRLTDLRRDLGEERK